jgi:hypothetical protein
VATASAKKPMPLQTDGERISHNNDSQPNDSIVT